MGSAGGRGLGNGNLSDIRRVRQRRGCCVWQWPDSGSGRCAVWPLCSSPYNLHVARASSAVCCHSLRHRAHLRRACEPRGDMGKLPDWTHDMGARRPVHGRTAPGRHLRRACFGAGHHLFFLSVMHCTANRHVQLPTAVWLAAKRNSGRRRWTWVLHTFEWHPYIHRAALVVGNHHDLPAGHGECICSENGIWEWRLAPNDQAPGMHGRWSTPLLSAGLAMETWRPSPLASPSLPPPLWVGLPRMCWRVSCLAFAC